MSSSYFRANRPELWWSLAPTYEHLKARGGRARDECIVIGQWPVQFLFPGNDLELEAVRDALTTTVDAVATRVLSSEDLIAIALNTGRAKDHTRILQFIEQVAYDPAKLRGIIERHGLQPKWRSFERKFLEEQE